MMEHQARFLVLRGGAIGDFVLTLPALRALRDRWPDAYIELVGYPRIAALARAGGLVDRVESLDKADMARLFAPGAQFAEGQAEYIRSFDVVVSYLYDPDRILHLNLLCAKARQVICGSPIVTKGHAVEQLAAPLAELAIFDYDPHPRLCLEADALQRGKDWLRARGLNRALAIHPGSGSPGKNWATGRFIDLARRVASSTAMLPFFVLGEADRAIAAVLAEQAPEFPAADRLGLVEVASLLAGCAGYVGNDSGISHLAAALGIPVVSLFGPTDPAAWGPRGPRVAVLRADDGRLEHLSVDEVFRHLP
jgi:ADP-heptose:LPS heptosyltransferase